MLKEVAFAIMVFLTPDHYIDAHVHVFKLEAFNQEECEQALQEIYAEIGPVEVVGVECYTRKVELPEEDKGV